MANIKTYNDRGAYNASEKPTTATEVGLIKSENAVVYDGINVQTLEPELGDAVYKDADGNKVAFKSDGFTPSLLSDLTYVGVFIGYYKDGRWKVFMGNYSSLPSYKYADVVQFSITAITATNITFFLKMAGDYANFVQIDVSLTSAEINATSASEINAALEAAGNTGNVGYDKHKYWAYLADANGNPAESGGTQIIVQCDNWFDYRQYQCNDGSHALVGCVMTLTVWGDMPVSGALWRNNGVSSYYGGLEFEGFRDYYATNGATPTADIPLVSDKIVNKTSFEGSEYCALLRSKYKNYDTYMRSHMVRYPQKYGVFALPDGEYLTKKYGGLTATIKTGTTKAKFPALNWALTQGGYLWDVHDGVVIMDDDNLAAINATQQKVGKVQLAKNSTRWFAGRYNATNAWLFDGTYRSLYYTYVRYTFQVGAVSLL